MYLIYNIEQIRSINHWTYIFSFMYT